MEESLLIEVVPREAFVAVSPLVHGSERDLYVGIKGAWDR